MVGLLLAGVVPAYAQHERRFNPPGVGGDHELRFFDHADLSEYGTANRAKTGFFFQYDRLIWGFTGPDKTDIGNAQAEGVINNTITTIVPGFPPTIVTTNVNFINNNTLDTGFANNDYVWGNRWELGYMDDNDHGWMASIAHVHNYHPELRARNATIAFGDPFGVNTQFVDFNGDGIDDDLNGNFIFGNTSPFNFDASFPPDGTLDTYLGPDFGDLFSLPVSFGNIYAFQRTSYSSYEVMHLYRWDPLHSGATVEWLCGLRYTQISDDFNLFGSAGTGLITDMTIIGQIRNHLVGPQIGVRWNRQEGAWRVGAEGRFMAAANFQQAQVNSQFFGNNSQLQSGTIVGGIDEVTDTTWAPLGELRLDVSYQLTNAVSLRCGYTGLVAGGVGWASRRINYQLPQALVLDEHKSEAFVVNGFHFGVEVNR